ncbi:MarR family winged helix-turn-helix transcriptional regulator [Sphingomonas aracearum]|uniref:MarR family transcriptional regulator n=1 Tax=Sphingomonas aracearum TaxID=2283317 RepID=A0A369W005_9SPHN|nr:MarR family transcriptional regulator [Sphingomonas aracearum]RDE06700.1 MarR family transcriptional regulator [Sphingomonas aracearum]
MSAVDLLLRATGERLAARIAARVAEQGVSGAEAALMRVLFEGGPAAPSLAAERLGVSRGAVSRLADALRAKRLVVRARMPGGDRRMQTLALTGAGALLMPALLAAAAEETAAMLSPLSSAERAQLAALLGRVVAGRTKSPAGTAP